MSPGNDSWQQQENKAQYLGQAVDVALVDQLVVGWVDAALVDAEHVFIWSVWM